MVVLHLSYLKFIMESKQGYVLSPYLFNLVMNDLQTLLDTFNGIEIDNMQIRGLLYADNIILIADI